MAYANARQVRVDVIGAKGDKNATAKVLARLKEMGEDGKKLYSEAMKGVPESKKNPVIDRAL